MHVEQKKWRVLHESGGYFRDYDSILQVSAITFWNDKQRNIKWCFFHYYYSKLKSKSWICDSNGVYSHPNYDKLKQIESDFTNLIKFIIYAGNKMSDCGYQVEIGDFIYMININGFYDWVHCFVHFCSVWLNGEKNAVKHLYL